MTSVDDQIDALAQMSRFELRALWRRHWKAPPPMHLSQDMLLRGVAYKIQEQAYGGLTKADLRKLAALAPASLDGSNQDGGHIGKGATNHKSANRTAQSRAQLREGNRLVREWNGVTHTVLVLTSGFEWQGKPYRSLTQIAEAITGAHWSGPRFFGVVKRSDANATKQAKQRQIEARSVGHANPAGRTL